MSDFTHLNSKLPSKPPIRRTKSGEPLFKPPPIPVMAPLVGPGYTVCSVYLPSRCAASRCLSGLAVPVKEKTAGAVMH